MEMMIIFITDIWNITVINKVTQIYFGFYFVEDGCCTIPGNFQVYRLMGVKDNGN